MRFATPQGFNSGDQFYAYLKDSSDALYAEGDVAPKMLSIGLHCRLVGRPGRAASLARFIDYVQSHDRAWTPTRFNIARHWILQTLAAGRMETLTLDTHALRRALRRSSTNIPHGLRVLPTTTAFRPMSIRLRASQRR